MRKIFFSLLIIAGLFTAVAVTNVSAAPAARSGNVGPYEGTFHGTVYGSDGSRAPMSLVLTHRGSAVDGTVFIGEGLYVDAGFCGEVNVPASTQYASGRTVIGNPRQLAAESSFNVSGIPVTVDLNSVVSGGKITAEAKIDLPWLCGTDPVLNSTLHKA